MRLLPEEQAQRGKRPRDRAGSSVPPSESNLVPTYHLEWAEGVDPKTATWYNGIRNHLKRCTAEDVEAVQAILGRTTALPSRLLSVTMCGPGTSWTDQVVWRRPALAGEPATRPRKVSAGREGRRAGAAAAAAADPAAELPAPRTSRGVGAGVSVSLAARQQASAMAGPSKKPRASSPPLAPGRARASANPPAARPLRAPAPPEEDVPPRQLGFKFRDDVPVGERRSTATCLATTYKTEGEVGVHRVLLLPESVHVPRLLSVRVKGGDVLWANPSAKVQPAGGNAGAARTVGVQGGVAASPLAASAAAGVPLAAAGVPLAAVAAPETAAAGIPGFVPPAFQPSAPSAQPPAPAGRLPPGTSPSERPQGDSAGQPAAATTLPSPRAQAASAQAQGPSRFGLQLGYIWRDGVSDSDKMSTMASLKTASKKGTAEVLRYLTQQIGPSKTSVHAPRLLSVSQLPGGEVIWPTFSPADPLPAQREEARPISGFVGAGVGATADGMAASASIPGSLAPPSASGAAGMPGLVVPSAMPAGAVGVTRGIIPPAHPGDAAGSSATLKEKLALRHLLGQAAELAGHPPRIVMEWFKRFGNELPKLEAHVGCDFYKRGGEFRLELEDAVDKKCGESCKLVLQWIKLL